MLLVACALVALIAAGCGSSSSTSGKKSGGSGAGHAAASGVVSRVGTVAAFLSGPEASNPFSVAEAAGYAEGAKQTGLKVKVFDPSAYDPSIQYAQIQDALSTNQYKSYVIDPAGSNLCKLMRNAVQTQHINVVVIESPLCGENDAGSAGLHSAGTLTYIGGNANLNGYIAYWKAFVSHTSGTRQILSVTGPEGAGNEIPWITAQTQVLQGTPRLHLVGTVHTDYTTPTSVTDVENFLQAHKNVDSIVTNYITCTIGAVTAVKDLGLQGKIKIYDVGGDQQAVDLIKAGKIVATAPYFPKSMSYAAMLSLERYGEKKSVPVYQGDDGNPAETAKYGWISSSNVGSYIAQY